MGAIVVTFPAINVAIQGEFPQQHLAAGNVLIDFFHFQFGREIQSLRACRPFGLVPLPLEASLGLI